MILLIEPWKKKGFVSSHCFLLNLFSRCLLKKCAKVMQEYPGKTAEIYTVALQKCIGLHPLLFSFSFEIF